MTRDDWECSSDRWQDPYSRCSHLGKAILDPHCAIRCCPTRCFGPACDGCYGNSCPRGSNGCDRASTHLQAFAFPFGCSSRLRVGVGLGYNQADKGGAGATCLRGVKLADRTTLFLQRQYLHRHRILSHPGRVDSFSQLYSSINRDHHHTGPKRRALLFPAKPSPDPISLIRRELQELDKCQP